MLPIDFSSQKKKKHRAKFLGHCDSLFRIYGHFKVFWKLISTVDISVLVFGSSRFMEIQSPRTVFKISGCGLRQYTHN